MKVAKEKRICKLWILVISLLLCACNGKSVSGDNQGQTKSEDTKESQEIHFLEEVDIIREDNTLDEMYAVLNLPLKSMQIPEGANWAYGKNYVCETGCVRVRKYRMDSGNWSEVSIVTPEGEEKVWKSNADINSSNKQDYLRIGTISGKNGYVALEAYEQNGIRCNYQICILDENFRKTNYVSAELSNVTKSSPADIEIMGDVNGCIHLIYYGSDSLRKYAVISQDGKVILEGAGEKELSLCSYAKGEVALREAKALKTGWECWFFKADIETGTLKELAVSKDEGVRNKMAGFVLYASLVSEYRMALCKSDGLYLCDSREGKSKLIYKWSNHGMMIPTIKGMMAMSDGRIGILYEDANGLNYLVLQTTSEKKEITSITFAVSSDKKESYLLAAAYFNKRYPAYNVNVTDEWDEISLLTKLGAGDGPVLIDTALTGFEDLEKLWQPLDGFLEQTGLTEQLLPEALNFGKIGNAQYGIVRSFYIRTLVVSGQGPDYWDYESFLKALEETQGAAPFSYWYFDRTGDRREAFFDILSNGINDSYLLNLEEGSTIFGTTAFDRVVKLSENAKKCQPAENGKALRNGKALCEVVDLRGIQNVVELRMRMEANGERAIGYPTKEGAKHFLVADHPITMRVTATDEEKEIAYTFLKLLLSKDGLTSTYAGSFYVRKDTLDEQFENYELTVKANESLNLPALDREKDTLLLNELIQDSTPKKSFPSSLQKVFDEEFGDYLSGRIDGKALSEHLKSRVTLWLQENR